MGRTEVWLGSRQGTDNLGRSHFLTCDEYRLGEACSHEMSVIKATNSGEDRLTVTQAAQGSGQVWVKAQEG